MVDLDTLREMLAEADSMAAFYAGHGDTRFHTLGAEYGKRADVLRYVITYHSGGIFAPAQEEAA